MSFYNFNNSSNNNNPNNNIPPPSEDLKKLYNQNNWLCMEISACSNQEERQRMQRIVSMNVQRINELERLQLSNQQPPSASPRFGHLGLSDSSGETGLNFGAEQGNQSRFMSVVNPVDGGLGGSCVCTTQDPNSMGKANSWVHSGNGQSSTYQSNYDQFHRLSLAASPREQQQPMATNQSEQSGPFASANDVPRYPSSSMSFELAGRERAWIRDSQLDEFDVDTFQAEDQQPAFNTGGLPMPIQRDPRPAFPIPHHRSSRLRQEAQNLFIEQPQQPDQFAQQSQDRHSFVRAHLHNRYGQYQPQNRFDQQNSFASTSGLNQSQNRGMNQQANYGPYAQGAQGASAPTPLYSRSSSGYSERVRSLYGLDEYGRSISPSSHQQRAGFGQLPNPTDTNTDHAKPNAYYNHYPQI